ncbi:glycoprotein M6Bb isoform X1 [Tachysurus ichikawai]
MFFLGLCLALLINSFSLSQIHYLMILSANWAYLKDASQMHTYQDIKIKEEQELQDIQSHSKERLSSYS